MTDEEVPEIFVDMLEWIIEHQVTAIEELNGKKGKDPIDLKNTEEVLAAARKEGYEELAMFIEKFPKTYLKLLKRIRTKGDK